MISGPIPSPDATVMAVFSAMESLRERPSIIPESHIPVGAIRRRQLEAAAYNRRSGNFRKMSSSIRYRETTDLTASAVDLRDGLALRFDPTRRLNLRFRLQFDSADDLEALRYARRVMIREERTRGLEWEEPSLEDAVFTINDVSWAALATQAAWCREKIAELVERAVRVRRELVSTSSED